MSHRLANSLLVYLAFTNLFNSQLCCRKEWENLPTLKVIKVWPLRNSIRFQLASLCWNLLRCLLTRLWVDPCSIEAAAASSTEHPGTGRGGLRQPRIHYAVPVSTKRFGGRDGFRVMLPACPTGGHTAQQRVHHRPCTLSITRQQPGWVNSSSWKQVWVQKWPVLHMHPFNSLQTLRALLGAENAPSKAPSSMSPENQCFLWGGPIPATSAQSPSRCSTFCKMLFNSVASTLWYYKRSCKEWGQRRQRNKMKVKEEEKRKINRYGHQWRRKCPHLLW